MRQTHFIVLGITAASLSLGAIGCTTTSDTSHDTSHDASKEARPMQPEQRSGTPMETGTQDSSRLTK